MKKRIHRIGRIAVAVPVRIDPLKGVPIIALHEVIRAVKRLGTGHVANKLISCKPVPGRIKQLNTNEIIGNGIVLDPIVR
ncbi:hypothetical protein D3C78_1772380 [compost metagenome]